MYYLDTSLEVPEIIRYSFESQSRSSASRQLVALRTLHTVNQGPYTLEQRLFELGEYTPAAHPRTYSVIENAKSDLKACNLTLA
jgi:hypothetical protein